MNTAKEYGRIVTYKEHYTINNLVEGLYAVIAQHELVARWVTQTRTISLATPGQLELCWSSLGYAESI